MSDFRPFRGLRFAAEAGPRLAPPYDVIAPEERESLAEEPENIVHLTLPPGTTGQRDYDSACTTLERWIADGVLRREARECLYVLRESTPEGRVRRGFIGALRLADYEERIVLPHERTLPAAKRDRLLLTRAVRANLEPLFFLYEDRDAKLDEALDAACASTALCRASGPGGTGLELYALEDRAHLDAVRAFLADLPVVIADGHHRYETALAYRREQETGEGAGCDSTLAFFANLYAKGSLLLPIHRVVQKGTSPDAATWEAKLPGFRQETAEIDADGGNIPELLEAHLGPRAGHPAFAADDGSATLRIFWRDDLLGDELMVRIIERDVLGGVFGLDEQDIRKGAVSFPKSSPRAAEEVRKGTGVVALYLNPLDPDDVFRVTQAGERMPQKSTFFSPKVPTGLVFRVHQSQEGFG